MSPWLSLYLPPLSLSLSLFLSLSLSLSLFLSLSPPPPPPSTTPPYLLTTLFGTNLAPQSAGALYGPTRSQCRALPQ